MRTYVGTNQHDPLWTGSKNSTLAATGTVPSCSVPVSGNRATGRVTWTGTPTGTLTLETSYDQLTWTAFAGATFSSQPAGSASACTFEAVNLTGRWFRVLYTASSGTGTIAGEATQHLMAAAGSSTSAPLSTSQVAPVVASANAWSVAMSTALAAKLVIKASAGNLRSLSGRVDSTHATGTYYLQLWNLTDVPAESTAVSTSNSLMAPLKIQHVLGTDSRFVLDFPDSVYGSAGITVGLSTTEFTKTASGAFLSCTAEYK